MLKKVAIGLAVVVLAFIALVATRPSHFHVERSVSVSAPPEVVFSFINDFRRWPAWSPWEKLDPGMKREYSGSAQGLGARYDWTGNDDVGSGSMRIEESQPSSRIRIALEFKTPFEASNEASFSLAPEAGATSVTWSMDGESNFMFKAMGLFMNMDEAIGKDFQEGLGNLKRLAEAVPPQVAAP
jgi:carbon monoxide dehydrogenase subunit G